VPDQIILSFGGVASGPAQSSISGFQAVEAPEIASTIIGIARSLGKAGKPLK
jgi:hypothetical protein